MQGQVNGTDVPMHGGVEKASVELEPVRTGRQRRDLKFAPLNQPGKLTDPPAFEARCRSLPRMSWPDGGGIAPPELPGRGRADLGIHPPALPG